MEVVAKSNFVRMTPRKLSLVAALVRGLGAGEAVEVLGALGKRAARPILLTLKQGIGNAVNNFNLEKGSLKIKSLQIGKGPIAKRWRFVGRGRAHQVQKKTGHIRLVLEGEKAGPKTEKQESRKTKEPKNRETKKLKDKKPKKGEA